MSTCRARRAERARASLLVNTLDRADRRSWRSLQSRERPRTKDGSPLRLARHLRSSDSPERHLAGAAPAAQGGTKRSPRPPQAAGPAGLARECAHVQAAWAHGRDRATAPGVCRAREPLALGRAEEPRPAVTAAAAALVRECRHCSDMALASRPPRPRGRGHAGRVSPRRSALRNGLRTRPPAACAASGNLRRAPRSQTALS